MSSHPGTPPPMGAPPPMMMPGKGNSTSTAAAAAASAAAKKASALKSALVQYHNQSTAWYFAVAMSGLIVLFTLFHWSRFLYIRYSSKGVRKSMFMRVQVAIARSFQNALVRQVPGFTSLGHAILVSAYLLINMAITVTNVDWSTILGIAKRSGRMALINIAFVTFLALKNTPLAFLTSYSHERLNQLHRVGGYTAVTYIFIHMILMVREWTMLKKPMVLLSESQIHGMVAACAAFVTLVAAVVVRRMRYEVFYITHIAMYCVIIVNIACHRPDFADKSIIITIVAGSMWASDHILRSSRLLWYSFKNKATITPLPHGGTRVVLNWSPSRAKPGNHCFLWIPKICLLETHPFTIVSSTSTSLELVIAACDGFTNDLHQYAKQHPGASLTASVDGPYGATPNFAKSADKVILIAGGSGASFTFGVALDMLKTLGSSSKTKIEFIWSVKEHDALSWFTKELAILQSSPLVNVRFYTTRSSTHLTLSHTPPSPTPSDSEKHLPVSISPTSTSPYPSNLGLDIEKHTSSLTSSPITPTTGGNPWTETITGRPDISALVQELVRKAEREERVAIVGCGPDGLMSAVRRVAAGSIRVDGPSIEVHCEQFGW